MKNCTRLLLAAGVMFASASVVNAIPQMISYQGILTDAVGAPITVSTNVEFRIWDGDPGGTELWMEMQSVMPDTTGRFNVLLGANNPIPDAALAAAMAYLGITVSGDSEMSPRTRLVSVAYAYRPGTVDGATGGTISGDVAIQSNLTVDGDISASGNVGVGSAPDPFRKLVIFNDTDGSVDVAISNPNTGTSSRERISFNDENGSVAFIQMSQAGSDNPMEIANNRPNSSINFTTNGGLPTITVKDGKVGIENTNPAEELDVVGDIHATGTIISGNSITIDGTNDKITSSGGTIDFDDDDIVTTGKATIGPGHTNTGTSAFVAGANNNLSGDFGTISGGQQNVSSGISSTIGGGASNSANGDSATVAGGWLNRASESGAFVGGGTDNWALGWVSAIAGGRNNRADSSFSTVGGGWDNTAIGEAATVSGGQTNTADTIAATVGGGKANTADGAYSTVSGGILNGANANDATVGGGSGNIATGNASTISGGLGNRASETQSTVGGGLSNIASGFRSTVSGGRGDTASGSYAAVPGGIGNRADGDYSFAGGNQAKALHDGAFVWSDGSVASAGFPTSTESNFTPAANMFMARTTGGAVFVSGVDGSGNSTSGVELAAGDGSWSSLSDRNLKEHVRPVQTNEVLEKIASMPISSWNYLAQSDDVRHLGPMAQDFYAAFGLGQNDRHITAIDADGVALAAIQELYKRNQNLVEMNASLMQQIRTLNERLTKVEEGMQP